MSNPNQALIKINWSTDYSVGIPVIDEQHKELFELVNTLISYFDNPEKCDLFITFLHILTEYTVEHFTTEEKFLLEISNEIYENQHLEHEEFKNKILDSLTHEMENDLEYRRELILFLQKWLVDHIINFDIPAFYK